jgi:hypothetical protein
MRFQSWIKLDDHLMTRAAEKEEPAECETRKKKNFINLIS